MSEPKIVEVVVRNITDGPKILNAIPPGILAAGDSTDEPVKMTEGEIASAKVSGWFEFDGKASKSESPAESGPLDGSLDDLATHLATVTDADEVQKLIDAETAGKSRKGALAALESRRDELLA